MAKIVQTITAKINNNHDHAAAQAANRKLKEALAPHGIHVAAHYSMEAGPASGFSTLSFTFPSATKWGEMVDSDKETLVKMRATLLEHCGEIVSTSLLQEVEL